MVDLRFKDYQIINNNKYGYILYKLDLDNDNQVKVTTDKQGVKRLSRQVIGYYNTIGQSLEALQDYQIKMGKQVLNSVTDFIKSNQKLKDELDMWVKSTGLKLE